MALKDLIGNHVSMIFNDPNWVSFSGPDKDIKDRFGFYGPPWKNKDGDYDAILILWNENGIICEVDGPGEHCKEVIA